MRYSTGLLILMALFALTSCTSNSEAKAPAKTEQNKDIIKNVNTKEFADLTKNNNIIILDVRTPQEIANGFIEGASFANVMAPGFEDKTNLMNKEATILVYCKSGGRSSKAAKILEAQGFKNIYNLNGGMGAWESDDMPTVIDPDLSFTTTEKPMPVDTLNEIIQRDSVVMVVFSTQWCAPCKKLTPELENLKSNQPALHLVKLDAEVNKALATQFEAPAVPTIIVFKNGIETQRHTGYLTQEELSAML